MKQKLLTMFAAAALLLGMSACTNEDNPSPGQEEETVVAPAQLKQGVWTEFDEALITSGKYTEEELAAMPAVGMMVDGDKGYFFTYTAEGASDLVEGKISYDNTKGTGTITFPAIKDNPLSEQAVNFSMTTDETMQFEFTYQGKKTTGTCAWLCQNLDNWNTEITEEDWKELMAYYQTISEEAGPDPSIDWGDLDEPLEWNEDALAPAGTRATATGSAAQTIGNVFSSLFEKDDKEEINEKLDELLEKVDQVLANQQVMIEKLDEINGRLISIANKMNQQETVTIFNNRNEKFYNQLNKQNIGYFKDAYKAYKANKKDPILGDYAKQWVGDGKKYIDLTWDYAEYITSVQHTKYGTGLDKIYDGLTFDKYPWEHLGIGDRQNYRDYDLSMIAKSLFMICLYAQYGGLTDIEKKGLYNQYTVYAPKLEAYSEFNVSDPSKLLVCQIPGAHFVMHKQLQEYNYGDIGTEAPDPRVYGRDVIYMPRWHVAGDIKISNPAEMKTKLIHKNEMDAIRKYFGPNQFTWYDMLMEGHEKAGGAISVHKPANLTATMLLYDNGNNGAIAHTDDTSALIPIEYSTLLRMYSVMLMFATYERIDIQCLPLDQNEHKWLKYNGPKQFYSAVVEKRF